MKKILLIEDNKDVRENTAEILELAGYQVITAANGKAGVEEANNNKPDLIVCDIMMPVLDGYGVFHLLSKSEATAGIPFIFLTAKAERSEIRKGMDMGADDYITKPFDKIDLLNAIDSRLRKMEALKKDYQRDIEGLTNFIGDTVGKNAAKNFLEGRKISSYRKKENIYREGDMPRGLYHVNKGSVKLFKIHDAGKELITNIEKTGDYFGYMALLEDTDYTETAQALEDSELAFIPRDDFFNIINNNREIAARFLQMLTRDVSEQQEKLLHLAYSSVRKRVATALLKLNEAEGMSISREDLAHVVGTSSETLIRTISDFKDEKLVETREGKIFVVNEKKLQQLKN